jgi:hypothetical protein
MDKHFDVEKLFNQQLQNFELETTPEFDRAMEQKIDRLHWPKYLKWIIGGMMVVLGLGTYFIDSNNSAISSEIHTETIADSSPKAAEEVLVLEEGMEEIKETKTDQTPKVTEETIAVDPTPEQDKTIPPPIFTSEKKTEEEPSYQRLSTPFSVEKKDHTFNYFESQNRDALAAKPNLSPTSLIDEAYIEKERLKEDERQQKQAEQKLKQQIKEQEDRAKQKEKELKQAEKRVRQEQRKSNQKQSFSFSEKEDQKQIPKAQKDSKEKTKKVRIPKSKKPGLFEAAVELSAAPIFIRNLSPPLEPKNDTVTNWLTNKVFKPSYDFGVEFLFKQKESNWLLKTGMHYQKFSEEVNYYFLREYIDEEQSYWMYDSIFEYHIDPPNFDTVLVGIDSSYYEYWKRSETTQKHTNHYQYLNIPLLLGYQIDLRKQELDYKKGFDLHVLVGTGLGILLKSEGYHYDTDGYIYPYPSSQKTTIDWYLNTQLAINYHWKNASVFVKPKMQFQMRKRSFDAYFEKRHYLIYGVDFGVRIKIFLRQAPKRDKLSTQHI